jgi:hypothetical protein
MLLVFEDRGLSQTILLALIKLDFTHNTYGLIDTYLFSDCYKPALVCDKDTFAVFCTSICKDGRLVVCCDFNVVLYIFRTKKVAKNLKFA